MEDFIFNFNDRKAIEYQDDALCDRLLQDVFKKLEADSTTLLRDIPGGLLSKVESSYHVEWKARYASAILFCSQDSYEVNSAVHLVGLDHWNCKVHSWVEGRQNTAYPDVTRPHVFCVGSIPTTEIDMTMKEFTKQLAATEQNTGSARRQSSGHQGNQKTPSFARTVLLQAIQGTTENLPIEGGTTDVGLHTDCRPRNTSFPLVLSVLRSMLSFHGQASDEVFYKCVACYYAQFLIKMSANIKQYDCRHLDRAVTVLRELEKWVLKVSDSTFRELLINHATLAYNSLLAVKPHISDEDQFIKLGNVAKCCEALQSPTIPKIPELQIESGAESRRKRAKKDSKRNLGWSTRCSLVFTGVLQDAWVQFGEQNLFFWEKAQQLASGRAMCDIEDFESRLNLHSKVVELLCPVSGESCHLMATVLRSCEALAVWIGFCWAHRVAVKRHSLFRSYSAALNPSDLQHLVLDDDRGIRAAECVRRFLESHQTSAEYPFRVKQDTLALARQFGLQSEPMLRVYNEELAHAHGVLEIRHKALLQKQQELSSLDGQLRVAKVQLDAATSEFQRSVMTDYSYCQITGQKLRPSVYYRKQGTKEECEGKVESIKTRIKAKESKPPDLFFSLPEDRDLALQWLFFIYLPKEFQMLSRLAHRGQSFLWEKSPEAQSPSTDLINWFYSKRTVHDVPEHVGKITLGSFSSSPHLSTPGIRQYQKRSGVFFPDSITGELFWIGTNPFAGDPDLSSTILLYTEKLSGINDASCLQDFLSMNPNSMRGNLGLCQRHNKPDHFTHENFQAFSSLRAFPHLQIRQLVSTMVDNLLPFEDHSVHVIVKQLMFHIGEKSWKTDLIGSWEGLTRLGEQLRHQADLLRQSPKDSDRLLLFGIMSSYFGQYSRECLSCATDFARIARGWGDSVNAEVKATELPSDSLYWKQAKFYGYAALCFSYGQLSQEELFELTEAVILFNNKKLFALDVAGSSTLDQPILQLMSYRIEAVTEAVRHNLGQLSQCLGLIKDEVPRNLEWVMLDCAGASPLGCFEAEDDQLYSINLLNGTVLIDGIPPGVLPLSITSDRLFLQTFGNRNFEIESTGYQKYRTSRKVEERYIYEFVVDANGVLHIFEVDTIPGGFGFGDTLQLLRDSEASLPTLLVQLHSQWYSKYHQKVFLRAPFYQNRSIRYVICASETFIVPFDLQSQEQNNLVGMLDRCDRLLVGETAALRFLDRMEHKDFIHISSNLTSCRLKYTLPRCKLTFEHTGQSLKSIEFDGFVLRKKQIIDDTFTGFLSYLVLVNKDGRQKLLIPNGKVGLGNIAIPERWQSPTSYFTYNVHDRFKTIAGIGNAARLHLAAVYAANSSCLADNRFGKPGTSVAIELVRQCWTNEPLNVAEKGKLMEIAEHSNLSCTLRLMCTWLWQSSISMKDFYCDNETTKMSSDVLKLDTLAVDEYWHNEYVPRLAPDEEWLLLGSRQEVTEISPLSPLVAQLPSHGFVEKVEATIACQHLRAVHRSRRRQAFPLDIKVKKSHSLAKTILSDLSDSWFKYCSLPKEVVDSEGLKTTIVKNLALATERRTKTETSLLQQLCKVNKQHKYLFGQLSGKIPSPVAADLLRMAWEESQVLRFEPFLSRESLAYFRVKVIDWMVLCVLEDKLKRLGRYEELRDIKAEIQSTRNWNPMDHPWWLAFEVEQQLQIRPDQYSIVNQLLKTRGTVTQLNMGKGKTRVLTPMLLLELSRSNDKVVRLTVLPSILNEAKQYFRSVLTASVQHLKILSMPFHRDNVLDKQTALLLSKSMSTCQHFFGCLILTPQHRNSLLLKQHDNNSSVTVRGLEHSRLFDDILDESDQLLHHDFQLVYATGEQIPLPDGPSRWGAVEAFLQILADDACDDIRHIMSDAKYVHRESRQVGSFPGIRFLALCKSEEEKMGHSLCVHLVRHPPYQFRWMQQVPEENVERLVAILSKPSLTSPVEVISAFPLFLKYEHDILAIRGCIAYRTLFHALYGRHQVNYGLHPAKKKMMAVPYSASGTPKLRSEYSHPDISIAYTSLAYCHSGLTPSQFRSAIVHLQNLGNMARKVIYDGWINSIRSDADPQSIASFDDILKVDVDNICQLQLMYDHLHCCIGTIFFWLNKLVFPYSTDQFPARRASNAWNLVDSGCAVGFSGTDDNRFLLPLDVKQVEPCLDTLCATNGEMVDCILRNTKKDIVLLEDRDQDIPLWNVVIASCVSMKMSALIDVGGLMAGPSNHKVAVHVAEQVEGSDVRGVVYFDTKSDEWMVLDKQYKHTVPLQSSSIKEAECFVFFDQSRCRGVDMKLKKKACACVTLEPTLTKDKFLQGCARMRNLHEDGQSIVLAGTAEVVSAESTTKNILETILGNTVDMVERGIFTYYQRGMEFTKFPQVLTDDIALKSMYGAQIRENEDLQAFLHRTHESGGSHHSTMATEELADYCHDIGEGVNVKVSRLAEECEQELEEEVEEEEQMEVQIPVERPYAETTWKFAKAFSDPESLVKASVFIPLKKFLSKQTTLSKIKWSSGLLCTNNFWNTIARASSCNQIGLYLRPVNAVLILQGGNVVLLSEYEADQLLPHWWETKKPKAVLQHLCMTVLNTGFGGKDTDLSLNDKARTGAKLFRGYTHFSPIEREVLQRMFQNIQNPRKEMQEILWLRDRIRYFDRSDLDDFIAM